jgi:hypothetical protein
MFPQSLTEITPSIGETNLRADFARMNGKLPATPHLPVRDAGFDQLLLPVCCSGREEIK